jgi:PAS domain-containing protein
MSDVVKDAAGQPIGVVTTCEDISERKRAEAELRRSEERYVLAARGTNDGLWDWDLAADRVRAGRPCWAKRRMKSATGRRNGWTASTPMICPGCKPRGRPISREPLPTSRTSTACISG